MDASSMPDKMAPNRLFINPHWSYRGYSSLDTWRQILRKIGFEIHEEPYHLAGEQYRIFVCIKP